MGCVGEVGGKWRQLYLNNNKKIIKKKEKKYGPVAAHIQGNIGLSSYVFKSN